MVKFARLDERCLDVLCAHVSQIAEFPPSVPAGLLEILFFKLVEKRLVDHYVLGLFLRSSMQVFRISKTKISGITVDDPQCSVTVLRIDNMPILQQLYIHKAPHLRTLSIAHCPNLDTIFVVSPSLKTVDIPNMESGDNKIKNLLLDCCTEYLDISGCQQLLSCTIIDPNLETLDLSMNRTITELNIRCDSLRTIDLSRQAELVTLHITCKEITNLELNFKWKLAELNLDCRNLHKLVLKRCPELASIDIRCPSLSILDLSNHNRIKPTNVKLQKHILQFLSLCNSSDFNVSFEDTTLPATRPPLSIDLSNCIGLTDAKMITLLQSLQNINMLDLTNTAISDATLHALPDLCPNLETLNLTGTVILPRVLQECVTRMPSLRYVYVEVGTVQPKDIQAIQAEAPNTKVLCLPGL